MLSLNMIYIFGAVALVALIVLVLVLRVVRARKDRAPAPAEPAFFEAAPDWASGPDTWPADDEPPATGAKPVSQAEPVRYPGSVGYTGPADDAHSTVVAEPAVEAPSAPTRTDAPPMAGFETPLPSSTGAKAPAIVMSGMDPILVLVKALLQNSGELTPVEFRRLELYRPQRIVDAVDALTPQITGRANESKRSRLQRIRHYAVSLMAEFDSEEKGLIPESIVTPEAATVEPVAISLLSPPETTQVLLPEDWGASIGGSELNLDPELSLLHDDLSPAPEPEDNPALASEYRLAPAQEPGDDDLAPMSPQELARALALSDDIDFKKAAIDALERLGTPEALSQLQHSLEDPDPDVQLYALSAAERLLGP